MKNFAAIEFALLPLILAGVCKRLLPEFNDTIIGNAALFAISFGVSSVIANRRYHLISSAKLFGASGVNPSSAGLVFVAIISMFVVCWNLIELEYMINTGVESYFENANEIFMWGAGQKFFLTNLILAPIAEEIYYRGIIMAGLQRLRKSRQSILFSAVLFSIGHLQSNSTILSTLFYSFVSGAFYGWLFNATGDLKLPIFAHFFWNFASYLFLFVMYRSGLELDSIRSFLYFSIPICILSFVSLYITVVNLKRRLVISDSR